MPTEETCEIFHGMNMLHVDAKWWCTLCTGSTRLVWCFPCASLRWTETTSDRHVSSPGYIMLISIRSVIAVTPEYWIHVHRWEAATNHNTWSVPTSASIHDLPYSGEHAKHLNHSCDFLKKYKYPPWNCEYVSARIYINPWFPELHLVIRISL